MKTSGASFAGHLLSGFLGVAMSLGCALTPAAPSTSPPVLAAPTPAAKARVTPTVPPTPEPKWGTITVSYDQPKKKAHKKIAKALKESQAYEKMAKEFSEAYKLPVNITIRFTELGEENAYWDPETHEITVGYELIDNYSQIFDYDKKDPEAYRQEVVDAGYFTVFHELGHGLVEVLNLPFTGSEEDAVDEFAAIALIEQGDEQAELALISGIEQFSSDAEAYGEFDESSYSDEHSLDKQRFYDVLSLVYGSDPEAHADLLGGDYLPEEMAEDAEIEYQRKAESWNKLLEPHLRKRP